MTSLNNIQHYYPYIGLLVAKKNRVFHALCDKEGNNIIAWTIICDLDSARL